MHVNIDDMIWDDVSLGEIWSHTRVCVCASPADRTAHCRTDTSRRDMHYTTNSHTHL